MSSLMILKMRGLTESHSTGVATIWFLENSSTDVEQPPNTFKTTLTSPL